MGVYIGTMPLSNAMVVSSALPVPLLSILILEQAASLGNNTGNGALDAPSTAISKEGVAVLYSRFLAGNTGAYRRGEGT